MTRTTDNDTEARRAWMIDEFRQAQQRRQPKRVEPATNSDAKGNADTPAVRDDVVISSP